MSQLGLSFSSGRDVEIVKVIKEREKSLEGWRKTKVSRLRVRPIQMREINPKSSTDQDPVDRSYEQNPLPVAFELGPEALRRKEKKDEEEEGGLVSFDLHPFFPPSIVLLLTSLVSFGIPGRFSRSV